VAVFVLRRVGHRTRIVVIVRKGAHHSIWIEVTWLLSHHIGIWLSHQWVLLVWRGMGRVGALHLFLRVDFDLLPAN